MICMKPWTEPSPFKVRVPSEIRQELPYNVGDRSGTGFNHHWKAFVVQHLSYIASTQQDRTHLSQECVRCSVSHIRWNQKRQFQVAYSKYLLSSLTEQGLSGIVGRGVLQIKIGREMSWEFRGSACCTINAKACSSLLAKPSLSSLLLFTFARKSSSKTSFFPDILWSLLSQMLDTT